MVSVRTDPKAVCIARQCSRRRRVIPTESGEDHAASSPRVLLVVEQLRRRIPGGIGTYARGVIQGFAQMAVNDHPTPDLVLLASRAPPRGARANPVDPLDEFGLETSLSRLPGPLLTRAWDRGLVNVPAGFDIVHCVSLAVPPHRADRSGIRTASVVAVHDVAWRRYPELTTEQGRTWHERALHRAVRTVDAFVVPSQATARDLEGTGVPSERIHVIPYGSDHLSAPDVGRTEAVLRRLDIGAEFLLTVGTVEPRKNLDRLVAAYARARSQLPEAWPLLVVGPTGWGCNPPSSDPPGVYRLGEVDDGVLAGLYARARLFAYVPIVEGFGFPPLEAMRMGLPVVASHGVPSVGEATEAEAALMVDPFDVESIEAGLVTGATDHMRRQRSIEQGARLVQRRTWEKAASDHADLWASLR